jgi:hypothetical protein
MCAKDSTAAKLLNQNFALQADLKETRDDD